MNTALSQNALSTSTDCLYQTLTTVLNEIMDSIPAGSEIVIQAGHHFLGLNQGEAHNVFEPCFSASSILSQLAEFAEITWAAACQTAASNPDKSFKLMTLVNDWQYLKPAGDSRNNKVKEAARLRSEYYQANATAPGPMLEILAKHGFSEDVLMKQDADCWLFSEQLLRHRFEKTLKTLLADPAQAKELGLHHDMTSNNEPVVNGMTEDGQPARLLYCGNSNCCGEVIQLLSDLQDRGTTYFVNLYPAECRAHVSAATELAKRIFGLENMNITNIAITPLSQGEVQLLIN